MSFYNKVKWVLGILLVFALILTTNLIDQNNFIRVRDSVETIYEDRLVAKDLIFQISEIIHDKEMALATRDTVYFSSENGFANDQLKELIAQYEVTKLTKKEVQEFDELQSNLVSLFLTEQRYATDPQLTTGILTTKISDVNQNLKNLSKIQMSEGNRQLAISRRAVSNVELFTQIEIYFLVVLAIAIQIIVMYQPKR
jgi:hypothetical protein